MVTWVTARPGQTAAGLGVDTITGGVNSVRGFFTSTIGPKDANDAPIGGSKKLVGNVELLFPFPGMANDKSVRLSAFVDAGLIGESYTFTDTRVGVGLAVLWVSPFGPIKISAAQPFRAKEVTSRLPVYPGQLSTRSTLSVHARRRR
jgi:outer membrane protein assembly factor BamA